MMGASDNPFYARLAKPPVMLYVDICIYMFSRYMTTSLAKMQHLQITNNVRDRVKFANFLLNGFIYLDIFKQKISTF